MNGFIAFGIHLFGEPKPIKKNSVVSKEVATEFVEYEQPYYSQPSDESECPPGG